MGRITDKLIDFLGYKVKDVDSVVATLSERVAYKKMAMYIASSYIANAISKCEIKVLRGGDEVRDDLYYRLNVSPNPNQSAAQWVNSIVTKICTRRRALVVPHRDVFLYGAADFSIDPHALKDDIYRGIIVEDQPLAKTYRSSNAYLFQLEDRDVASIINDLYEDYGKLITAAITSFRRKHGSKYRLSIEQSKVGDANFEKQYEEVIKKQLKEFMDNDNAVFPEFKGYKLEPIRTESDGGSEDIIAMRKEIFDLVAQAYKIPISMMYGNTNNTKDVEAQFLTYAVDPIAQMMSDELTRKSFTIDEWKSGSQIIVDTKRINHIDIFNVADNIEKLISCGVFSIDQMLETLGFQPLKTEFSQAHWITKNYGRAEDLLTEVSGGGEI